MKEASGYLDASQTITKLEIPEGKIDGSMGDIHIYGNPHYWTDPENADPILNRILSRLVELRPADAEIFRRNYQGYSEKLAATIQKWKAVLLPFKGAPIVTYHNSWPYFVRCFGLGIAGYVEPKPGIPPTPRHISMLVDKMRASNAKILVMEPYFNLKTATAIAEKAGAKVVVLSPSVGGVRGVNTYIDLLEYNVNHLADALKK
jgi:zinc/manganese transport system substrate-binding protein